MAFGNGGYNKIAALVLLTLVGISTPSLARTMAIYDGHVNEKDDLVAMESRGRENMEANVMTTEGGAVSTPEMKVLPVVLPDNPTTVATTLTARLTTHDAVTMRINNMKTAAATVSPTVTPSVASAVSENFLATRTTAATVSPTVSPSVASAVSEKMSALTEAPKGITSAEATNQVVDNFQVKLFGANIFGPILTTTTTVVPTVTTNPPPVTFRPLVHIANKINRHRVHQSIIQRLDQLIAQGLTTTTTTTTTTTPPVPPPMPTSPMVPTTPTVPTMPSMPMGG